MQEFDEFATQERIGWASADIVSAYVKRFGPVTDYAARKLISLGTPEGKSVLDLCCGQGGLTAMLIEAGAIVTGLDFSEEMLALAAKNAPDAVLQQGDAAMMPFEDGSFDQVACNFGMMHLPDQAKALSEIKRVLRSDGRFMMATWATPDVSPAFGAVFGAIGKNADFSNAPAQPDLFTFARPDDAKGILNASGLRLISHENVITHWHLDEPDELFEIFLTGTVAASQLIKGQKPDIVEAIRDQITDAVRKDFAEANNYSVPVAIAVLQAEIKQAPTDD